MLMYMCLFFFFLLLILFLNMYKYVIIYSLLVLEFNIYCVTLMEFKFYFYLDYISIMFLIIITLISLMTFMYSKNYMSHDKNNNLFLLLTFMFVMMMYIVVMSLNSWLILLGWDGLGIISFFLVIFYHTDNSNYSGLVTIMINRLGDTGMIMSLFFMMNFMSLDFILMKNSYKFMNLFIMFILLGCATKSSQFPFNSWLPLAMAAPTPISALVHSSTLVTAGVYMLVRLNVLKDMDKFNFVILLLTLITMLLAGVCALVELDLKKIIALSTLSQLGFMMMIVILGNELMAFYHIMTHALFKALLFLCSGVFIHETLNNQDIRNFYMIMNFNYLLSGVFIVCSISLMGFPFLSGFYSKDLILDYCYSCNFNLIHLLMIMASTIFTVMYSLRMVNFSLLSLSKSYKMIYIKNWDMMYSSLVMSIIWVLIMGSAINWLLIDKMLFIYLTYCVKLMSMFILMMGFILSMLKYTIGSLNVNNVLMKMLYLNNFLNYNINYMNLNMMFFSTYSEFYLEKNLNFSMKKTMYNLNMYINYIKFMSWWVLLSMILVMSYIML